MRAFIFVVVCFSLLFANKIDSKIKLTKKEIENQQKEIKKTANTLEELGKKIVQNEKKLNELNLKIKNFAKTIKKEQQAVKKKKEKIKLLQKIKKEILKNKNKVERELIDIIANNLSMSLVIAKKDKASNQKDVINSEILKQLNEIVAKSSKKLRDDFLSKQKSMQQVQFEIEKLQKEIDKLISKKDNLEVLKAKQQKSIKKLRVQKLEYKKKLQRLFNVQDNKRRLLSKLKITKIKEIKRRIEIERKKSSSTADIKIKQKGSSYQRAKTVHYRGKKVKGPLSGYEIVRKFGPYIDPVYHIKIFNDSITLRPKQKNAIVRSVLSGKVVFAKDANMLGKTVIIKHNGGLHTIYSNLSKIAPGIKAGKRVKKRMAIGRVEDELKFEVTKGDSPFNPLELIY